MKRINHFFISIIFQKTNVKNFLISLSVLFAVSCKDYLDTEYIFKERMSTEDVFISKDYTDQWLAYTYTFLYNGYLNDVCSKNLTPFCFADDMYFWDRGSYPGEVYKILKNGEYAEYPFSWNDMESRIRRTYDFVEQIWFHAYRGIRHASVLIHNIDINEELTADEIADYRAQARFLRAYYYWAMLRVYGPIPLLPDEGIDYMLTYDEVSRPRDSYDDCVKFITDELVLSARDLPLHRDMLSMARPTRGAALALRAKVLLYAASPLMNGQNGKSALYAADMKDKNGKNLLAIEYDERKWALAAAAAKDVIDLRRYELYTAIARPTGDLSFPATIEPPYNPEFSDREWPNGWSNIDPFESYRAIFNGTVSAYTNPELIFSRINRYTEEVWTLAEHNLPVEGNGWNCHGMTQKQCDAYYMNNGDDVPGKDKEIGRGDGSDRPSGYVTLTDLLSGKYPHIQIPEKTAYRPVSMQYADREPRFYASVAYNGSLWNFNSGDPANDRNIQVFYYRGEQSGYAQSMKTIPTCIGIKKFVNPEDSKAKDSRITDKVEPAIRYAEILLIYAEALNELKNPYEIPSWDGSYMHYPNRDITEMAKGIRPIRIRAGIPDFEPDVYLSPELFREKLKRERQIEFMGEGHRYFDVRRWMDADVEEALQVYGCNMYATGSQQDMFHSPVPVPSLPATFSRKMWFMPIPHVELRRNNELSQNPGWTYPD